MGSDRGSGNVAIHTFRVEVVEEQHIRELAYKRWEMRQALGWRSWENASDDWQHAIHIAKAEEVAKQKEVQSELGKVVGMDNK